MEHSQLQSVSRRSRVLLAKSVFFDDQTGVPSVSKDALAQLTQLSPHQQSRNTLTNSQRFLWSAGAQLPLFAALAKPTHYPAAAQLPPCITEALSFSASVLSLLRVPHSCAFGSRKSGSWGAPPSDRGLSTFRFCSFWFFLCGCPILAHLVHARVGLGFLSPFGLIWILPSFRPIRRILSSEIACATLCFLLAFFLLRLCGTATTTL